MNIGIISDTHDDLPNLKKAVRIFNERKVSYVFHAGDYVFPGAVKEFKNFKGKLIGVLGNNDGEKIGLLKNFEEIGGELFGEFGDIELDGLRIAIYHGTNNKLIEAIIASQIYDLVICGHSHLKRDDKIGNTLVLNPGSAHNDFPSMDGIIQTEPSIIIFNTSNKSYQFVRL